ncbi:hypothetical protein BD769DRAFT_1668115 [Suillus cothurnatus]|nr:hypothetical protein BD769DRAFT_1668115 [Suillus cothurnatus]
MELASSRSPASSPPRPSSPAFTNTTSSSATHVELTPLEIFKKADYSEFPTNMTTALLSGSDCSLSPKLSPSLPSSPKVYVSPVEEIPYLPDVHESLLYKPSLIQSSRSPSRATHLHERSSKRHIPYPLRPSPLEVHLANCVTGQVREPDFTLEQLQKHKDTISGGLLQMSYATLYKVFKALLAGHEAIRHEVATSLWQAIYNDECEMLCAITAQAEVVSTCLGPCAKRELLASTSKAPYLPCFIGTLPNKDSIMHVLHGGFTDVGTDTDTDSDVTNTLALGGYKRLWPPFP